MLVPGGLLWRKQTIKNFKVLESNERDIIETYKINKMKKIMKVAKEIQQELWKFK